MISNNEIRLYTSISDDDFLEPQNYASINDYRANTLKSSPSIFQKIEKYVEEVEKRNDNKKKKKK